VLTVRNLSRKGFTISALAYAAAKSSAWRGWWGPGAAKVMESLFGMESDSGEVLIEGAPVTIDSPSWRLKKGWRY
jgi:inositol transport system ATP-binding protein